MNPPWVAAAFTGSQWAKSLCTLHVGTRAASTTAD